MIRMLIVGYVFAIRSERLVCGEVQVNLAYRWFCKLGIEDAIPDHSAFSRVRNERFRMETYSATYSSGRRASRPIWLAAKALRSLQAWSSRMPSQDSTGGCIPNIRADQHHLRSILQ
jgi:Transposase domain (DUF772)